MVRRDVRWRCPKGTDQSFALSSPARSTVSLGRVLVLFCGSRRSIAHPQVATTTGSSVSLERGYLSFCCPCWQGKSVAVVEEPAATVSLEYRRVHSGCHTVRQTRRVTVFAIDETILGKSTPICKITVKATMRL
jgi:hypothetical protein